MSLPPRTPLPSGIPLRRGTRDRPVSHIRTLSQQSVSPGISQHQRSPSVKSVGSPLNHVTGHVSASTSPSVSRENGHHSPLVTRDIPSVTRDTANVTHNNGHVTPSTPTAARDLGPPLTLDHVSPPHAPHVTSHVPQPPQPISVHAVIRIKPSVAKSAIAEFTNTSITVTCAPQKRTFLYDHIFGPQTTQSEIYAHFQKSADQFVAGYNVTIMAYGQSGAGKSYTMGTESVEGVMSRASSRMSVRSREEIPPEPTNPDPDQEGIVQRAAEDVFRKLAESRDMSRDEPPDVQLAVSYVELYNEQFRDLLDPNPKPQPQLREDAQGHVHVSGLAHVTVTTLTHLLHLLRAGSELRQKGSTALNSESSRSHAIFTLTLTQNGASSKFNFVDLAGSERLKNSEAKGDRVREGIAINGGLAALGKVISQLSQKSALTNPLSQQKQSGASNSLTKHISYRDSKLTRLLQDSLGGKAVTYLLSCITCDEAFVSETLSTLSYTQRARAIQLTPEISQNEAVEFDQMKREMEYWRGRARELERARDMSRDSPSRSSLRDTPSRMSTRDSPSRMSTRDLSPRSPPRLSSRDSPTRFLRDSPSHLLRSPTRHARTSSHDSLKHSDFDVLSPDTTFSPRDSNTDVSRTSPESRDNGFSRLNNTTEMHSAVEDMIKQYDLRIRGLEEENRSHVMKLQEEQRCHVISQNRIDELERMLEARDEEIRELEESRARSESRATQRSGSRAESRGTVVSETESVSSRAPLESKISILENHLDNSRVQHRRTLDELKRLSSHYESLSRDLERSRKEVEKEKQLRYDVIAQMKRSSVSESREESREGMTRSRTASSFTTSLFASLPRVADSELSERDEPCDKSRDKSRDTQDKSRDGTTAPPDLQHFH